jgi:[acyl-carrier-protein] S-malonyltransferase
MWNQRHPDIPARSADEFRSAGGIVDWIARHAG